MDGCRLEPGIYSRFGADGALPVYVLSQAGGLLGRRRDWEGENKSPKSRFSSIKKFFP